VTDESRVLDGVLVENSSDALVSLTPGETDPTLGEDGL